MKLAEPPHTCRRCGRPTAQGPHRSLHEGRYFPACCSADECQTQRRAEPTESADAEARLLVSLPLPPTAVEVTSFCDELVRARLLNSPALPRLLSEYARLMASADGADAYRAVRILTGRLAR